MAAAAEFKRENREWTSHQLLEAASAKLPGLIEARAVLSRLSREDWIRAIGVDPPDMTERKPSKPTGAWRGRSVSFHRVADP
jgi:hypothetical protein